jgi:transcriptional regulator with XRE-family HTH domain
MRGTVTELADAPAADRPFPELLRSNRERAGLTQRALADLSTISPRAIRDIEAGRAHARTQTVHLLADGLKLQGLMRELFVHAGLSGRRAERPGALDGGFGLGAPRPVNALLGRETEVRAMADVLESGRRRAICISGLPGVGKTRVAGEIAARLHARRGWPVLWIGADGRGPGASATALGPLMRALRELIESGTRDLSRICALIGAHEALLVLDGVADTTVPLGVEELLAYCPGVRMISTSRAPWQIPGVQSAVLPPLATPAAPPDEDRRGWLEALPGVPAVRLLTERLAEVSPGYTLGPAEADAAAEVCRRLDGLPLALEAAAGRFGPLSLRQLAAMPEPDLLDLGVPDRAGGGPRTIGGLVRAGFELLDPEHRAVLRRLARFDRAWTAADATGLLRRPLDGVVDDLNVLIGCGLVRASPGAAAADLYLPNLLRAFLLRRESD